MCYNFSRMRLPWRNGNEEIIAVLDVASASVRGVLLRVLRRADGTITREVLASVREETNFLLDVNFDAFWRVTKRAAARGIAALAKRNRAPDRIEIIFSSPWFVSETRAVRVRKEQQWEVTRSFLDELRAHEEARFLREKQHHLDPLRGTAAPIEHAFMKLELNGYGTRAPVGKTTRSLYGALYMSLGVRRVLHEIEEMLLHCWGDRHVSFHTFPLVALTALRPLVNTEEGFVLVHIGGEITEIVLLRDHAIEALASFPVGAHLAVRALAGSSRTTPHEAQSTISLYFAKRLNKSDAERVARILSEAREEWCARVKTAIDSFGEDTLLPQTFFVISEDPVRKALSACISDDSFAQKTVLGMRPTRRFVNAESVAPFFVGSTDADVTLLLGALAVS